MLIYYVKQALWIMLLVSGPIVLLTVFLGLLLGLLQAVFQLQDQAMPFGVKLIAVTFLLIALGPWMSQVLIEFTNGIFVAIDYSVGKHD